MIPLLVLAIATLTLRAAGAFGAPFLDDWLVATKLGLAVMFIFTGMAHFGRERADFVRMVPPALPAPRLLVAGTGLLQIVLALLLIWPDTTTAAALGLMALLVLMVPANVHAARAGHTIRGRRPTPLVLRLPLQVLFIALLWWSGACRACIRGDAGDPYQPLLVTDDLHRFVRLVAPGGKTDTTCAGVPSYLDSATHGLRGYARRFRVDAAALCAAIRRTPERYTELAARLPAFDSVRDDVALGMTRFRSIYPRARFVPAYVVVGTGISGGTTTLGRRPVILVGAELAGKTTGLARTVLHELMHVQQEYPAWGVMTGGPPWLRGTLLRHAIKEGSADFLVELALGPASGSREHWAQGREADVWRDFQRDMHGRDYSRWLYNGWNRANLEGRPPDLGYYVGYEITRAYYERAADKARAVREILTIRDFGDFLARSGYAGGAERGSRDRYVD